MLKLIQPGTSLEKLLLSPEVLKKAKELDTEMLQSMAQKLEAEDDGALAVVSESGSEWKTIALEEEVLAEKALDQLETEDDVETPPSSLAIIRPEAEMFDKGQAADLFDSAEVAKLKIEALTNVEPPEKISSTRKPP